jgi:hypothetical protein
MGTTREFDSKSTQLDRRLFSTRPVRRRLRSSLPSSISTILVVGPQNPPVCRQAFSHAHLKPLQVFLIDKRTLLTARSWTSHNQRGSEGTLDPDAF